MIESGMFWDELMYANELAQANRDINLCCANFVDSFDREYSEQRRSILWAMFLDRFREYHIVRILFLSEPGSSLQTKALNVISERLLAADALKLWRLMLERVVDDKRNKLLSEISFEHDLNSIIDLAASFPTGSVSRLLYSRRVIEILDSLEEGDDVLCYIDHIANKTELIGSKLLAWCHKEWPDYFQKK